MFIFQSVITFLEEYKSRVPSRDMFKKYINIKKMNILIKITNISRPYISHHYISIKNEIFIIKLIKLLNSFSYAANSALCPTTPLSGL